MRSPDNFELAIANSLAPTLSGRLGMLAVPLLLRDSLKRCHGLRDRSVADVCSVRCARLAQVKPYLNRSLENWTSSGCYKQSMETGVCEWLLNKRTPLASRFKQITPAIFGTVNLEVQLCCRLGLPAR